MGMLDEVKGGASSAVTEDLSGSVVLTDEEIRERMSGKPVSVRGRISTSSMPSESRPVPDPEVDPGRPGPPLPPSTPRSPR